MAHTPSTTYNTSQEERALVVSLSLAGGEDDMGMRLSELRELAMTAGARVVGEFSQSRRAPDMATYIGPGKVEDLKGETGRDRRRAGHLRRRAFPYPAAEPDDRPGPARPGPDAAHPGHLRPARPDARGQAAGRTGPAQLPAAASLVPLHQVRAPAGRHRRARSGRDEAGERPPPRQGAHHGPRTRD